MRTKVQELLTCLGEARAAVLVIIDTYERVGAPIGGILWIIEHSLNTATDKAYTMLSGLTDCGRG